jgi:hypothetical protein
MTNDLIYSTFDSNIASYLKINGYDIDNFYWELNKKHNKNMLCFVFYQNPRTMQLLVNEYLNSDISKFLQTRAELTNLIRQTKVLTHDELMKKLNEV